MGNRPKWGEYFIRIAQEVSRRATCDRLSVGCVIVKDNEIVATGYNGSPRGEEHCIDEGCYMDNGSCVRTIHAEMNAIMQCIKTGIPLKGASLYVTHFPCYGCTKHIVQTGISVVYYRENYRNNEEAIEMYKRNGVKVVKVESNS